uniref:Uncharacterized protein n=1 Tax=Avena sativa TaxID=4498 RepID=A0ACD5XYY5_AVESA
MSSINGEAAGSPDARTVAMDTERIVAEDRGEGGSHGDGSADGGEERAMAMAVVTATSKKPSKEDQSHGGGSINPLLLVSARRGSWDALNVFLKREDAQIPAMMIHTPEFLELVARERDSEGKSAASAARDVEAGADHQPAPPLAAAAGALLKGVTPVGDTALHVVASNRNGDDDSNNFLKYVSIIYHRDSDLLFAKNHRGDTPLHCAARAGNLEMVSHLIDLAGCENNKLKLLRMVNKLNETALHEAIRTEDGRVLGPKDREALFHADPRTAENTTRDFVDQLQGMKIVKKLMGDDPRLAGYPEHGISPLYLAILLGKSTIALTLYHASRGNLSYCGADGQNALHVAVLRDKVMVELLVNWYKSLTTQVDKDGSTPLHSASTVFVSYLAFYKVFKANCAALYQADNKGHFPIHVAACGGDKIAVEFFLRECPDSAGLRDAKGKTFLHVAIEQGELDIVSYVCGNLSVAWILNMQDNEGNTALHLAIQARKFRMFCALFGNRKANLNLTNNQGETPRDLSISKIPRGMTYFLNSEYLIDNALSSVGANRGTLRWEKTQEEYIRGTNPEDEPKESERLKDAAQALIVASVLIATMAFGITFAIPGGYRADDHANGGTPTLAGRYMFDTFMMATTLAFICSSLATVGFIFAGIPMVNLITRRIYFAMSAFSMTSSVTCLSIAFALGVYMVLAPVARYTAVAICFITPLVLVGKDIESLLKTVFLARPLMIRKGRFQGMIQLLRWNMDTMVVTLWPLVVIFGWGGLARIHHGR